MITDRLDPAKLEEVLSLIALATDIDGVPPVAEHVLLHLRHGGDKDDRHFIAEESGTVVGYAHLDLTDQVEGPSAELVVHPHYRNRGIGRSLIEELRRVAGDTLRLWSHGDLDGARAIANSAGFHRTRTVIQMRRSLNDPIPELTKDVEIRHFLPGIDDEEWIALNNRSFIDHPEQSNWTLRDLTIRQKESWFDERGFLIAERSGVMAGFCWTKVHGGTTHQHSPTDQLHDHDPIGEIYIMGVDPALHGLGIGRAVTIAGLKHLRYEGIFSAMLYVDADNKSAIALYSSLGFTEWGRDVLYRYTV